MNFAQYPALAARTEKLLPTPFLRLEHASLGVSTEIGEIATVIKRIAIYGKSLDDFEKDNKTTLRDHLKEEIGDVLWYLPIIGDVFGNQEAFTHTTLSLDTRYGMDFPQTAALTSIARRLQVSSGRLAKHVEAEFEGKVSLADPTDEARIITRNLVDLAFLIGADIEEIAAANIAKLSARYPEKYSDVAAEARADKGGLDARNS